MSHSRRPGWDAQAIAEIAKGKYGDYAGAVRSAWLAGTRLQHDAQGTDPREGDLWKRGSIPGASSQMTGTISVPSVSVSYARDGSSTRSNELGMRPMQERAWQKRGEQYLLIKSPPASGKSRALMFIALDKLANQGLKQAIIVVPGENHRRELQRRAVDRIRLLGRLGRGAQPAICATRQAQRVARSTRSRPSWKAKIRF